MLTIKSMKQLRSSQNIRSFHACRQATGVAGAHLDKARLIRAERTLMAREAQRRWLDDQWLRHFDRAAGPLRVLPPAARQHQAGAW